MTKISQYTTMTTLQSGDLMDISEDTGGSTYASRSLTYTNLLTNLNSDLSMPAFGAADRVPYMNTGATAFDYSAKLTFDDAILTINTPTLLSTNNELRLGSDGAYYNAFKSPTGMSANKTYTLPSVYPGVTGQVFSSTTAGVVSWGETIRADKLKAIDGDGLYLVDDADNGIFVEDGGQVGINETTPTASLHIGGTAGVFTLRMCQAAETVDDGVYMDSPGSANSIRMYLNNNVSYLGRKNAADANAEVTMAMDITGNTTFIKDVTVNNHLILPNSSAPTVTADEVRISSTDAASGGAVLTIAQENAPAVSTTWAMSHRVKIKINGTEYYIALDAV